MTERKGINNDECGEWVRVRTSGNCLTDDDEIMNLRMPTRFASLAYIRGVMRFQQVTKTLQSRTHRKVHQ